MSGCRQRDDIDTPYDLSLVRRFKGRASNTLTAPIMSRKGLGGSNPPRGTVSKLHGHEFTLP